MASLKSVMARDLLAFIVDGVIWCLIIHACNSEDLRCGNPGWPVNGHFAQVNATFYNVSDKVEYVCDTGYFLTSPQVRECMHDGLWSGKLPHCVETPNNTTTGATVEAEDYRCGIPETPYHGKQNLSADAVSYQCHEGYVLSGRKSRNCFRGVWQWLPPRCTKPCPNLEIYLVSSVSYSPNGSDSFSYETVATYSCLPGCVLEGNAWRHCQLNGQWTGSKPECICIDCKLPMSIENAAMDLVDRRTTYNATVAYHCKPGFVSTGSVNSISICNKSGNWSEVSMECVPAVDCRVVAIASSASLFVLLFPLISYAIYLCRKQSTVERGQLGKTERFAMMELDRQPLSNCPIYEDVNNDFGMYDDVGNLKNC